MPDQLLTRYWGYTHFRPLQKEVIDSVLHKKDTLALMPTGGGKSICYQLPTLAQEGICIVVSPLIALMKDQVDELLKKDIKAIAITSVMNQREIDIALDNCIYGNYKFLYVSPERLSTDIFKVRVQKMKVNLLAIDEAHCISQWGHDFRPAYRKIKELRDLLPGVPVLALTASAKTEVLSDIQQQLEFKKEHVLKTSFERKNLAYVALKEENKLQRILAIVKKLSGTGIIYARNRRKTEELTQFLHAQKISADFYHAGLTSLTREAKQNNWMQNKTRIMVCTNAFGMGINKPNVRFVIHADMPDCPESYFQEAGRAGRDGEKAFAILLFNDTDRFDLEENIHNSFPSMDEVKNMYNALGNYVQLAIGSGAGSSFDFNIGEFCSKYNLKPLNVHNCFKFLEKEGYISVSESFKQPSRLHVIVGKEELYRTQVKSPELDDFIKLLLRSYPGLLSEYVKINEQDIATRAQLSRDETIRLLNKLNTMQIVDYVPQSVLPKVTFLHERLDSKLIYFEKENLKKLREKAVERMEWMVYYANSTNKCRSQLLLNYFGETDTYRCGICDVCLERNKLELSNLEFEQVSEQLKHLLHEKNRSLTELVSLVKDSREDKTLKVIQWLMDNNKIVHDEDGLLMWRK